MEIKDILKAKQFRFNKQFGQNFITDGNLLSAIVNDAGITDCDTVIEIGAGAGTLTRALAERAKRVIAFEIDRNLGDVLAITLDGLANVEVNIKDVMRLSVQELENMAGGSYKVVANLPYYITTPLIMRFVEEGLRCQSVTVMVQAEVADRLTAKPATPEYGAITAAVEARADVVITRTVNRKLFYPVPNVDSAVIRLDFNRDKYEGLTDEVFKLIKCAFLMRRKTLINNVINAYPYARADVESILSELGYDVRLRGETLAVSDFIIISHALDNLSVR